MSFLSSRPLLRYVEIWTQATASFAASIISLLIQVRNISVLGDWVGSLIQSTFARRNLPTYCCKASPP